MSAFALGILKIVLLRSQEKMGEVIAGWVVTMRADNHPFGNRSMCFCIGDSMDVSCLSFRLSPHHAVALPSERARPFLAGSIFPHHYVSSTSISRMAFIRRFFRTNI